MNTNLLLNFGIGFDPFARLDVVKFGKFALYGEAGPSISFKITKDKATGSPTIQNNLTQIGIYLFPGLSYNVNDHLILQTNLNFLSLNYSYSIYKSNVGAGNEQKITSSNSHLGINTNNIANLGDITIGAIFKF